MAKKKFSTKKGDPVRVDLPVRDIFYRVRREQTDILTSLVYSAKLLLGGGVITEEEDDGVYVRTSATDPVKAKFSVSELADPDKPQALTSKNLNPDAKLVKVKGLKQGDLDEDRFSDKATANAILSEIDFVLLDLGSLIAVMPRAVLSGGPVSVAVIPTENIEYLDKNNGELILLPADQVEACKEWLLSDWFGSPSFAEEAKALTDFLATSGAMIVRSQPSDNGTLAVFSYNGSEYMVPEQFLSLS